MAFQRGSESVSCAESPRLPRPSLLASYHSPADGPHMQYPTTNGHLPGVPPKHQIDVRVHAALEVCIRKTRFRTHLQARIQRQGLCKHSKRYTHFKYSAYVHQFQPNTSQLTVCEGSYLPGAGRWLVLLSLVVVITTLMLPFVAPPCSLLGGLRPILFGIAFAN